MQKDHLTDQDYWDNYWENLPLPIEIKKRKKELHINEILNVFDQYLPKDSKLSVLEIGGAPGQFLVYMYKNYNYKICSLDFSKKGCEKTRENFNILNIQGEVLNYDLFDDTHVLGQFDIVYSLGFIEHFSDLRNVVSKHLKLVKPNGILLLGVPNFSGINKWFLKRLDPQDVAKHNLNTMDLENWTRFEKEFCLETIFKGYVGGFEPWVFNRYINKSPLNNLIYFGVKILCFISHSHFKFIKKLNSKFISGYAIGIYRT